MESLLTAVEAGHSLFEVNLASLIRCRQEMEQAAENGDWQAVLRLDRLTNQWLAKVEWPAREQKAAVVAELVAIRKSYAKTIRHINFCLATFPSQAV